MVGRRGFAILSRGEVSEWLMVPLSKSGVRKHRGFESRPLRQHLDRRWTGRLPAGPDVSGERSPSGLWRRTGNAVWGNPSRVRIPPSPPPRAAQADPPRRADLSTLAPVLSDENWGASAALQTARAQLSLGHVREAEATLRAVKPERASYAVQLELGTVLLREGRREDA